MNKCESWRNKVSIYFAIDGLKQGDISKVIEYESRTGDKQFRIVKILTRTEPHVANIKDDYSKIRMAALEEKKGQHIMDWIDSKIKHNFIEIKIKPTDSLGKEISKCDILQKWSSSDNSRP